MWGGAIDSSYLLLSYPIIPLASHMTTILISTLFQTYLANIPLAVSTGDETDEEMEERLKPSAEKVKLTDEEKKAARTALKDEVLGLARQVCLD